ncbi:MAG: GNAT family N-acetyltransferase [Bacteroidota bacterium]
MDTIAFIPFETSLARHFTDLNLAWVKKYFVVEPLDEEMLSNPKSFIIDKGGLIFFAKTGDHIAGTFALQKVADEVYQLSKMAVDEAFQGMKIGNAMMEFCLAEAKRRGFQKIELFSNTLLGPAIHLYKKYGFTEVPLGDSEFERSNIKMEYTIQ